ncbi:MAG: o-succinylbenzoate synthase [Luteitalea sp.]|nr:o-succinylbenzoate synthase [Luteitalea sp.]
MTVTASARSLALPAPVTIDCIELRLLRLELVRPFETSFGRTESRLIPLVVLHADGLTGWGEIVALEEPLFNYETVRTACVVIEHHFAPALLGAAFRALDDVGVALRRFRGHPMARAGLELAWVDLMARANGQSVSQVLGGVRARVEVGVSLGIEATFDALIDLVAEHLAQGYRRIKVKIKPGWDVDVLRRIRARFPSILLSVDANAAYTLADADHLAALDAYALLMIEQPLAHDDLVDHSVLQGRVRTSLCLDESITSQRVARHALDLGSCRIINMKMSRVGGYGEALAIHDLCAARSVPLWCGGMLETGIGRAHNLALASLPGFTLPGDISASRRYYARDVLAQPIEVAPDGTVEVPAGLGIGVEIDTDYIESQMVDRLEVGRRRRVAR